MNTMVRNKERYGWIDMMKVLLLVAVVGAHSMPKLTPTTPATVLAMDTLYFLTVDVLSVCVSVYFIISGYLFFCTFSRFDLTVYRNKLQSRVKTLLVPYLIWNLVCGIKYLVKARLVGLPYESAIVSADGAIDWWHFLEGFVMVPEIDGFPYAFAFWFIRNLMIFVIFSPLVLLITRYWWCYALFMVAWLLYVDDNDGLTLYSGFEWFVTGAALAGADIRRLGATPLWMSPVTVIALVAAGYFASVTEGVLHNLWYVVEVVAMTALTLSLAVAVMRHSGRITRLLIGSSFFVYALHQCFCTVANKLWFSMTEITSYQQVMLRYAGLFLTLYGTGVVVWLILRRICPQLLSVLSGNRG